MSKKSEPAPSSGPLSGALSGPLSGALETPGNLANRSALVTGAGRGAGRATALMLARAGARVAVNDLDTTEANDTVAAIVAAGGDALAVPGDVTDKSFADTLISAPIEAWGGLDIVVNNAGYIWNGAMHNHSDEQWQAMLEIHASAPFRILRAWAPWLRETAKREIAEQGRARCRKVVNISSVSGTTGSATQIAYSAGKAAVIGITKTLAKEWGRYNVTVNCVAFGHLETRLTQAYDSEPPLIEVGGREYRVGLTNRQIDALQHSVPLQRSGTAEDGAGAVFLLCTAQSDYITGEVITCSGGV